MKGIIHVGLSGVQLEQLSGERSKQESRVKVSRRELSLVAAFGLTGGTTVSSTTWIANQVGIKTFATGGIGGVHRGGQDTLDVSADLLELARNPVTVISSGIKSILDIGRTLEYLETQGVTVATFERKPQEEHNRRETDCVLRESEFPAFFSPRSGIKVPFTFTHPRQVAQLMSAHSLLDQQNGILIGNPIPIEDGTDTKSGASLLSAAIEEALIQAESESIRGKNVTPFVLRRVNELTGGESLKANIALIQNNALLAAQVASQYEIVRREEEKEWNRIGRRKEYSHRRSCDGQHDNFKQTRRTFSTRTDSISFSSSPSSSSSSFSTSFSTSSFSTSSTPRSPNQINTNQTNNSNSNLCLVPESCCANKGEKSADSGTASMNGYGRRSDGRIGVLQTEDVVTEGDRTVDRTCHHRKEEKIHRYSFRGHEVRIIFSSFLQLSSPLSFFH